MKAGRRPLTSLRGMPQDLRAVVKAALKAGWTGKWTTSGHVMLRSPDGTFTYTAPGTPSDWRSTKNLSAAIKRWEQGRPQTLR